MLHPGVREGRGTFPGEELLSGREHTVARLVAAGANNRKIATRLFITESAVKNHVSSVLRKLEPRDTSSSH